MFFLCLEFNYSTKHIWKKKFVVHSKWSELCSEDSFHNGYLFESYDVICDYYYYSLVTSFVIFTIFYELIYLRWLLLHLWLHHLWFLPSFLWAYLFMLCVCIRMAKSFIGMHVSSPHYQTCFKLHFLYNFFFNNWYIEW
jgi:hypothetical protein